MDIHGLFFFFFLDLLPEVGAGRRCPLWPWFLVVAAMMLVLLLCVCVCVCACGGAGRGREIAFLSILLLALSAQPVIKLGVT